MEEQRGFVDIKVNKKPYMTIQINSLLSNTDVLGPYKRFGLWTQGCDFDCPGCMSPDSYDGNKGNTYHISDLVETILSVKNIEGITISGGEPFLQASALLKLVAGIKIERDLGIIVYTGYRLNELQSKDKDSQRLLENIDILIDGRYVDDLNDNVAFRGSSNQVVHLLSNRYEDVYDEYYNSYRREIEIHMEDEGMTIIGIPQKETLEKLRSSSRRKK